MSGPCAPRECPLPCVSAPPYTCVQDTHLSACVCVGGASLVAWVWVHLCGCGLVSSWWWCRRDCALCSHVQCVCVCVSGGCGRV